MKEEMPPQDTELQNLLDALQQHGADSRRQENLSVMIDHLASADGRHHRWIIIGAAASIAMVFLLLHPSAEKPLSLPVHPMVAEMVPTAEVQSAASCVPDPKLVVTGTQEAVTRISEDADVPQRDTHLLAEPPASLESSHASVDEKPVDNPHDVAVAPRVFVRESTRLVAMNPVVRKDTSSENSFFMLAMSSASKESLNPFTITF